LNYVDVFPSKVPSDGELRDWILQQRMLKRQMKKEKKAVNDPSEMESVVIDDIDLVDDDDEEDPAVVEEILRQQVEQVSQVTVQILVLVWFRVSFFFILCNEQC
jgi:hypothetical protein